MKSLLNDRKFINRRNFRNKQAPSAVVIYNDAVHTQRSTADCTGNQTQRYYLKYTSNKSRLAQECNLSDVHLYSQSQK